MFHRKKPLPPPAPLPTPAEVMNWLSRSAWVPSEHPTSLLGHPAVRSAVARTTQQNTSPDELPLLIVWHAAVKQCCPGRHGRIDFTATPIIWDTSGLGRWRPRPERCGVCGQPHEPAAVIISAPCDEDDAMRVHALVVGYPRA